MSAAALGGLALVVFIVGLAYVLVIKPRSKGKGKASGSGTNAKTK